jgi:hypothetical protein
MFSKIQSGSKNMLFKLIIGLKYWQIWTMKMILTKIFMKSGKALIENDGSMETLRNKWYDEEYKIAIEEMKKAIEK